MINYPLTVQKKFTLLAQQSGVHTLYELINYIQHLPYGRNADRNKPELVLSEQKGTCSTKHALIKLVADENGITEIKLVIGLYKMNNNNTPRIGDALEKHGLDHMPEAHCYLKYDENRIDITSVNASFEKIEHDLLKEIEITAEQTGEFKVEYHQHYLKEWLEAEHIPFSFDEIWCIREECINRLSAGS